MSVLSHEITSTANSGSETSSGREYSVEYRVRCDSASDGPATILDYFDSTSSVPSINDSYNVSGDSDSAARCTTIAPTRVDGSENPWVWLVRCEFTRPGTKETKPDDQGNETNDPLRWHADIDIQPITYSVPVERAQLLVGRDGSYKLLPDGTEIEASIGGMIAAGVLKPSASTGTRFDPGLEKDSSRTVIRVRRYWPEYPMELNAAHKDTVNVKQFLVHLPMQRFTQLFKRHELLCKPISGSFHVVNGYNVWQITSELHYQPGGWYDDVVDEDELKITEVEKDGSATTTPFRDGLIRLDHDRDEDDQPILRKMLLDGQGRALKPSSGIAAVYLRYLKWTETDFSALHGIINGN